MVLHREAEHLLSAKEVQEFLRIGRNRTYDLLRLPEKRGGIPHIRIGKSIRVMKRDLLDWCERHRVKFIGKGPRRS
ncbi:MAG: helix-turn-helix domain-containing protein [Ignavibacteriales bacterium]